MNTNYSLSKRLLALFVFLMIAVNSWVSADSSVCGLNAQLLNQSDTESEEDKSKDSSEDEEEDEEPECD